MSCMAPCDTSKGIGMRESHSGPARSVNWIHTSGQQGAEAHGPDVELEVRAERAVRRLVTVVESAGGGDEGILRSSCHHGSIPAFPTYDRMYSRVIAVEAKPVRSTIEVAGFEHHLLLKVGAIAAVRMPESEWTS
jgi:enamine deaminase RidA (YjgF/YER057c/UK114 family)